MNVSYRRWRVLFLFCFGLSAGAAFCMKWMEPDLLYNGELFTVVGLEISYPEQQVSAILSGIDEKVRTILRYHLYFDLAFMAGVFPGIAALCMMARERTSKVGWKKILAALAILQVVAWSFDIMENRFLLQWLVEPVSGKDFRLFHFFVFTKWILALVAFLTALPFFFRKDRNVNS
jgi:hypothetical protein